MLRICKSRLLVTALCLSCLCDVGFGQQPERPFTLSDEIGLWLFIPDMGRPNPRFSPDGKYFAVYSERGRLDLNHPEYSLRFYGSEDVENFLKTSVGSRPPIPVWDIQLATDKDGPIIHDWRWLPDSGGVAFVQRVNGKQELVVGDIRKKRLHAVSGLMENIESFDVRDLTHFAYTAPDPMQIKELKQKEKADWQKSAVVGTGRRLGQLLLPDDPVVVEYSLPRGCLWASVGGRSFKVTHNGAPVFPEGDMALSPDGRSLITTPASDGHEAAKYYVRIDLQTGSMQSLANAPASPEAEQTGSSHGSFDVQVKQGIDQPPLLVASNPNTSRVIWDPNPQLKNIQLGEASVYKWKDKHGREFKGGLFKPVNYTPGRRYPLVVQTHGFDESFFFPSGPGMPTAFAARALASVGIVVLQVDEDCPFGSEEGACAASAYESGVNKLISDGLVDPEKVGIIGFSRSCYYVMETLTASSLHLKAASITSGLMFDYWQYAMIPERGEGDAIIGTPPFGEGLQQWLKRSPGFNLDKVNSPLMVVGQGADVLLTMWAAYAGLRQLNKPVDLIMLNSDEHVLTNPAVRMASQGGSVDWFRFWLQGYEDPHPTKAEQYQRWRELKKMQAENEKKSTSAQATSN